MAHERSIGLAELAQTLEEVTAALGGEHILLPGLPAIARDRFLADPALLQKPAQGRINQVVVQRLPHDQSGFPLELIAVFRATSLGVLKK